MSDLSLPAHLPASVGVLPLRSTAPLPLQLAEVPLIQVWGAIPKPVGGVLPEEFWKVRRLIEGSDGQSYEVEIRGDAEYGVPHGLDGVYLLSFLALARMQGAWDGVIRDISMREVLRLSGRSDEEWGGRHPVRLREALLRLLRTSVIVRHVSSPRRRIQGGLELDDDRSHPAVPDSAVLIPREVREKGIHILDFDISELRFGADGTVTRSIINEIRIHPVWIDAANRGWLTWVDLETYGSLSGTIARNLYALLAARASRGAFAAAGMDWSCGAKQLAIQTGISPTRYNGSKLVGLFERASEELVEARVLSGMVAVPAGPRGNYRIHFHPGPRLIEVDHLRGTAFCNTEEEARIYAHLVRFGVRRADAAEVISSRRHQARLWVLFALFAEENPGAAPWKENLRAGYLIKAIREDWQIGESAAFAEWLRARTGTDVSLADSMPSGTIRAQIPAPPAATLPQPPAVDGTPESRALFAALREDLSDNRVLSVHLGVLAALAIEGDNLILACDPEHHFDGQRVEGHAACRDALVRLTEGAVTRIRLRLLRESGGSLALP